MLNDQYWSERYEKSQTGWDVGNVSPSLKEYFDQLTDKSVAILIPGCGNAYEAEYLLQQGFTDITLIDISGVLVQNLQEKLKKLMSEMDKNEEDWINKRLSQDLLNRQNSLMPELMQAEKALKEQGEDPKRESKNALQKWRENPPPNLVPYLKKQQENNMLFQKVPVDLWPKYQQKVQKYLEQFQR